MLSSSIIMDYGSIKGVDNEKLGELMQCVYCGDLNATKRKLLEFLGSNAAAFGYTKPVLIRAKVYNRLIAVALGLRPQDFTKAEVSPSGFFIPKTKDEKEWIELVDDDKLVRLSGRWVDNDLVVLRSLLKALEEDDDVMTAIFCDLSFFKRYPVPYFAGCEVNVIAQVSYLWLSKSVLMQFYFDPLIDPVIKTVQLATSKTDVNFIQAKLMLCKHLQLRSPKAGARLFMFVIMQRQDNTMVQRLVKDIFNMKALGNGWDFKDFFLFLWDNYWYNLDVRDYSVADRVKDGNGNFICVGQLPSDAHTNGNLLCWAARRGYHDLIWCVMQAYKPLSKSDVGYKDWIDFEVHLAWKYALWCAIRHGDNWEVIRELSARKNWVKDIDFNDYPSGWLPPLHLAALLGDMEMMDTLCKYLDVKSCANKKDYLGRTPLDYAMQFKITTTKMTTNKITYPFSKSMKNVKDYETPGHKDVVRKLLHMPGVGGRLKELYDMYIHQANTLLIGAALIASVTFAGWLQPPLGYTEYYQFTQPSPPSSGGTSYESYLDVQGHLILQAFVVFNSFSFFLAIATMFVGAEATLFIHDNDERTGALTRMRKSIKWMIGFFISSMLCIMAAFICAGMTILPPIHGLEWSMIVSFSVGGGICMIPLSWILWSLNRNQILSLIDTQFIHKAKSTKLLSSINTSKMSLIDIENVEKIENEINKLNFDLQGGENGHINPSQGGEGDHATAQEGEEDHTLQQGEAPEHTSPQGKLEEELASSLSRGEKRTATLQT